MGNRLKAFCKTNYGRFLSFMLLSHNVEECHIRWTNCRIVQFVREITISVDGTCFFAKEKCLTIGIFLLN